MKLEQLYYFQEAVKYRSISVAAKQNYISQSSFSGAISRLEQELGAPLLTRTNTGVEPTELGRLALEKAEAIFQAQSELVAAAKGQNVAGTVALQCIPGFHRGAPDPAEHPPLDHPVGLHRREPEDCQQRLLGHGHHWDCGEGRLSERLPGADLHPSFSG